MNDFLGGALMMGCLAIAIFFYKFWCDTGDKFFARFSIAFFILSLERLMLWIVKATSEETGWVYLIRLAAFSFIIYSIVLKNLRRST